MVTARIRDPAPVAAGRVRMTVWALHLALPVLVLWLLITQPQLDLQWQHNPSHFGLVTAVAAANVWLAQRMRSSARARGDVRLMLVALAFTVSAGFLLLHALATPGVLVEGPNVSFEVTTAIGLVLASVLLAVSAVELPLELAQSIVRRERALHWLVVGLLVVWGLVSLTGVSPLSSVPDEPSVQQTLAVLATIAIVLYLYAAIGFFRLHRRRPSVMLVALITASSLLAEAMVTVVFAGNWHISWWLWHLLMTFGFGYFVYSAYVQFQREGAGIGLFDGISTGATFARVRAEYGSLVESLTDALVASEDAGEPGDIGVVTDRLAARFGLTEGQASVLGRAAEALARERDQVRRQAVLARVGGLTRVRMDEDELLRMVIAAGDEGFGRDVLRIGLVRDGIMDYPLPLQTGAWSEQGASLSLPFHVAGISAGVLEVNRPTGAFAESDLSIFRTLASEVGIALENLRLYAQVEGLFRQYTSPDVAAALLADPDQARLGGTVMEVTALFADLRGFTGFSEMSTPEQVVEMLNLYFGEAVPVVLDEGGTVLQFVGDALVAAFNAPTRQPDHELRACRAALRMQAAVAEIAASNRGWPLFRVGVNTGSALVGNVGSDTVRSYSVMGDAINVAARLEGVATPGTVVIGEATRRALGERAVVEPLGDLDLKGKQQPVTAYRLVGMP